MAVAAKVQVVQAKSGNILANGIHSGIHVGGGNVANALNIRVGTTVTPVRYAYIGAYSIRRVV